MSGSHRCRMGEGFSLVEVVMAVGIVAFALLAIFGLLGGSLKISADTLGSAEALNARETLDEFLRNEWGGTNFAATYQAARGGRLEDVFVLTFTNNSSGPPEPVVYKAGDGNLASAAAQRTGRLLRASFELSPNFPVLGANATAGNFITADLPPDAEDFGNSALGVAVSLNVVPEIDVVPPVNARPVLRYDTTIPR